MNADLLNGLAFVASLACASAGAVLAAGEGAAMTRMPGTPEPPAEGATVIVDARGAPIPVFPYQRIVSLNQVADHVLLRLVEPERLVGVTAYTLEQHPAGWRFGGRKGFAVPLAIEAVIAARPDLVIVSKFAGPDHVARLRRLHIPVFDLGQMRGVRDTLSNIRTLGALIDVNERAARLAESYRRNLSALESAVAGREKPWGIYLTLYADRPLGGTKGSSYGDLLYYGGVRDLAAKHGYLRWPRYTPEQLLALDPPLIVTSPGGRPAICGNSLLAGLSACGTAGRVVEMPDRNHRDPGLGLVDAAQDLQRLVRGVRPDR